MFVKKVVIVTARPQLPDRLGHFLKQIFHIIHSKGKVSNVF